MTAPDRVPVLTVPIPSKENATAKALRLLLTGCVRITTPGNVEAVVNGDTGVYTVTRTGARWRCTCPGVLDRCSHVRAVRQVTAS